MFYIDIQLIYLFSGYTSAREYIRNLHRKSYTRNEQGDYHLGANFTSIVADPLHFDLDPDPWICIVK